MAGLLILLFSSAAFALGGDFKLTDQNGQEFRLSDHRDKVIALFFGYTHCPDICPDTLATVGTAMNLLEENKEVQVVFVSVDPSRDTPEYLKSYLAYFDESYIGLGGEWSKLKQVAKQWNARFSTPEIPTSDSYFVDHTADIYVIERGGKVHGVVPYGLPGEHLAKVLQGALSLQQPLAIPQQGLTDLDGNLVSITEKNQPTILHFWASWCAPCRAEFSDLEAAKEQVMALPGNAYAVNLGDRREGIERFLQDYPLSYPMLSDRIGYSEQQWGVKTLPQTLLIDANGEIIKRFEGAQPWKDADFIKQLRHPQL